MSQVKFNGQVLSSLINSTSKQTVRNKRKLFTTESSNPNVSMSFTVYLDLRTLSMCSSPSSSDKHRKSSPCLPLSHLDSECGTMLHCVCLFESFLTLHRSDSHNRDVGSISSPLDALEPSADVLVTFLTILRGKSDVNESLGCSLEQRSADVVVPQFQWCSLCFTNSTTS